MKMILLTHKGRNFVKVGMGVSRSGQHWTNCAPLTVFSGSRLILHTSGQAATESCKSQQECYQASTEFFQHKK